MHKWSILKKFARVRDYALNRVLAAWPLLRVNSNRYANIICLNCVDLIAPCSSVVVAQSDFQSLPDYSDGTGNGYELLFDNVTPQKVTGQKYRPCHLRHWLADIHTRLFD